MAQAYYDIPNTEALKDSHPKIVANFGTLRSSFEGDAAPDDPVKGQRAFVNGVWQTWDGSVWKTDPELHNHDDRYYTETETDTLLADKSNTDHTHDDRYYTETETDALLADKSDDGHVHDSRYYTESEVDSALAGKSDTTHDHDTRYAASFTISNGQLTLKDADGNVLQGPVNIYARYA